MMFLLLTLSTFGFKSHSLQTAHRGDECMQVFRADMAFILLRHTFSKVKAQKILLCCGFVVAYTYRRGSNCYGSIGADLCWWEHIFSLL